MRICISSQNIKKAREIGISQIKSLILENSDSKINFLPNLSYLSDWDVKNLDKTFNL